MKLLSGLLAAALCACLLPAQATGQISLYTVQASIETPVGEVFDFGSVAGGDAEDLVFRLKNSGAKLMYLTYLSLSGTGFSIPSRPLLPVSIDAGGSLDFTVHFQPDQSGSYSAPLQVNDISTILLGKGIRGLTVLLNNQPLSPAQTIDLGSVQVGLSQAQSLTLANQTQQSLTAGSVILQGTAFSFGGQPLSGITLPPGTSATASILCVPKTTGVQQGTLTIGLRSYSLLVTGTAPPPPVLPQPSLQVTLPSAASAQQGKISVNLDAASISNGSGTLTLEFQPAVSGVADDPAVTFSDGTRSVAFDVAKGASIGDFQGQSFVAFATGTTAGTLVFQAELAGHTARTTVTIPAAAIGIDAAVAMRNVGCDPSVLYCTATNVELQVNGWDNARTASRLVFRFFDSSGALIPPGDIAVDKSADFRNYFGTSDLAGIFGLHALFPISGDATRVVAVEVQLTNSVAESKTSRITF
ncbi:MAG: choice-of-anchor D domain-containing protein [Bryobacteraceae bacterium]